MQILFNFLKSLFQWNQSGIDLVFFYLGTYEDKKFAVSNKLNPCWIINEHLCKFEWVWKKS